MATPASAPTSDAKLKNYGVYDHAALATDDPTSSKVGKKVLLELGGTAADAAVAVALSLSTINFQSCGLGGGGFLVYYDRSSGVAEAINFREMAPGGAYKDMLKEKCSRPGLAVGVPGELKGLECLWQKYGRLEWSTLFEQAAQTAEEGFSVTPTTTKGINIADVKAALNNDPRFGTLKNILSPNGIYVKEGDILRRPDYAKTLRLIGASGGSDVFYKGDLTRSMVEEINSMGGVFTLDDFANYDVKTSQVIKSRFSDMNVYGAPPPCGCAILQFVLEILSEWNWDGVSSDDEARHVMVEAFKFAYAERLKLGDEPSAEEYARNWLDSSKADDVRSRIDVNATFSPSYYGVNEALSPLSKGTTHFSIVDSEGNAVAYTSSNGWYFGSKIYVKSSGIVLNNTVEDFSLPYHWDSRKIPSNPLNFVRPYKRPQSSSCPIIMVTDDGEVAAVAGASGGYYIPTTVALILVKHFKWGFSLKEAIDQPRFHHQCIPNRVAVQRQCPVDWIKGFEQRGHYVEYVCPTGMVQAVVRDVATGKLTAVCEYRKKGQPDGY